MPDEAGRRDEAALKNAAHVPTTGACRFPSPASPSYRSTCAPPRTSTSCCGGFSRAVNVGLQRALDDGRDAVLVNADIEFHQPQWLEPMLARTDTSGAPAAVVGARLLYPNGLLQHAGLHYSMLHRFWGPRFAFGAANLPEALVPSRCPVTGALQLIRHECLADVGLYDERFRMGWEDVDYCLRVFASGRECVYEPAACATHPESLFRSRKPEGQETWENDSYRALNEKYASYDLSAFMPAYE